MDGKYKGIKNNDLVIIRNKNIQRNTKSCKSTFINNSSTNLLNCKPTL